MLSAFDTMVNQASGTSNDAALAWKLFNDEKKGMFRDVKKSPEEKAAVSKDGMN